MLSLSQLTATLVCAPPQWLLDSSKESAAVNQELSLHYHIVFRVKNDGFIRSEWQERFHKYLAGCVLAAGGKIEAIGGTHERIHLLVGLPKTHALGDFTREIKLLSATWAKRKMDARQFAWQEQDEAFTVSLSQRDRVRSYIKRQKECDFQEEYASSWRRNRIECSQLHSW